MGLYAGVVRLEKIFRNPIIEAVEKGGLAPRECTFDFNDDGGCCIIHAPSRSSFVVEGPFGRHTTTTVVGEGAPQQLKAFTWATVEERVERWARSVKRDVDTPDRLAERTHGSPIDAEVEGATIALNAESVVAAWTKAMSRRTSDPDGAITAARSLLESVCKTILEDRGIAYNDRKDDLPKLYSRVSKALKLAPSDHTEEQFKAILGGCTTVVNGLGAIRNRASDAHGQGRKSYRPAERHAALAVNLAGSMALFLMETHKARAPSS